MVNNRYKIILSNNNLYKEVELTHDLLQMKVGTDVDCDIRLRKDFFFERIELLFVNHESEWSVYCSDNLYLTAGDVRKFVTITLSHGDIFEVKYQNTDNFVFRLEFLMDFDTGKKRYDDCIDISNVNRLRIGTSETDDITVDSAYIENNEEIELEQNSNYLILNKIQTKYGVYHNGKRAIEKEKICDRDFFSISDCFFYYKDRRLWTKMESKIRANRLVADISPISSDYPQFIKNTRIQNIVNDEKIEILDPPAMPQKPKNNIFTQLFPSIGMLIAAGAMAASGGRTMIAFSGISAAMSAITVLGTMRYTKKEYKENIKNRIVKYTKYIDDKRKEIEVCRDSEKEVLENIYISQQEEEYNLKTFSCDLFDRQPGDADFLCLMLGIGNVEAKRVINYKKQERIETEDELQKIPEEMYNQYRYISGAPVVCDLKLANAVGVTGSEDERFVFLKNFVIDIATRHYHTDVKMYFIAEPEHKDKIWWLRFLPHAYSENLGIRNIVCNDESKNLIFESLYKELTLREENKKYNPHILVFFYDEYGFNNHPISKFVDKAKEIGVTFLFFAGNKARIPVGCDYLIGAKADNYADFIDTADKNKFVEFMCSEIPDQNAQNMVNILAPVYTEEISLEGSLTKNISFFELLNIIAVDDLDLKSRWSTSMVYKSMAAPIGVSKTGIVSLNLHDKAHGPHGLVAGTTGSGKSEILQTYILSMATLFHPYEVAFLIIDFKGGGMANQFKELPHLLGAITNIDGKAIGRSLKSIKAELKKRQRLFAEADVNHIDKYIKKYKEGTINEPLPHLIIIVDEFAELKAEQPDFMKELISAARIGRSLGVHLILATQKPAGQVDDQIWSNSRFRLCLKVQNKEDSNEVLKSPLAAEIKEAGRAYLQVGNNEIFELFQSTYSGAPEKMDDSKVKEFSIFQLMDTGRKFPVYVQKKRQSDNGSMTQLDAIVQYVTNYCQKEGIIHLKNICLPPLPEIIKYSDNQLQRKGVAGIGIFDDPDNQLQSVAEVDIAGRNTLIIGSAQFGKTNLLQLIIRNIAETTTPKESVIYILDFGSMFLKNFEKLNHVGGVVCSSEDEKLKNLFKMLFAEIKNRKEILVSAGVSSFASYLEAGYTDLPHIYLMVDNMTALMELYLQNDDSFLNIVREGLAVGISVIVANAQTSGIGFRYMSNFANKIALYCNDSNEYINLYEHFSLQPDEKPGRCILEIDKNIFECQSYLAFPGEREIERIQEMHDFISAINAGNPGMQARIIPCIPAVLPICDLYKDFLAEQKEYKLPVGLTYNEVSPYYLDLANLGILGLCGKKNTGHRNFIKCIYSYLESRKSECPAKIVVFDDVKRRFAELKTNVLTDLYTLDMEQVKSVIEEWHEVLTKRYEEMLASENSAGSSELLLMIIQNNDAAKVLSDDIGLMEKFNDITSRYKGMNVAIIFTNYPNNSISYDAPEPIRMIKQERHCLFFEDLDNLKSFDVPYDALRANKKSLELGDAYYIRDNEVVKLKMAMAE